MTVHTCPGAIEYEECNGRPLRDAAASCGGCGRSWCDRCDPTPGPLCHYCNGRGYSLAPLGRYRPDARARARARGLAR